MQIPIHVRIRKSIWGKQPDVLGVKFSKASEKSLRADLHMIEVKVADDLNSIYQLIGEIEVKIALFTNKTSMFYALYPYLAVFPSKFFEELKLYSNHRQIGLIRLKSEKNSLSLVRTPTPIISKKIISMKLLKRITGTAGSDEMRIIEEAIKTVGWWDFKKLVESY